MVPIWYRSRHQASSKPSGSLLAVPGRVRSTIVAAIAAGSVATATVVASGTETASTSTTYRLDPTFADAGVATLAGWHRVGAVHALPDGSTLVYLERFASNGLPDRATVVKLRPDGTPDPSFAASGVPVGNPFAPLPFTVRSDGRFVVGTRQFLETGKPDLRFGQDGHITHNGEVFDRWSSSVSETSDGALLLVHGPAHGDIYGCGVVTVGDDGAIDVDPASNLQPDCFESVALRLADGHTGVLIQLADDRLALMRFRPDGARDGEVVFVESIGAAGPVVGLVHAATSHDGKLLILLRGAPTESRLIRVGLDGKLDRSFGDRGQVTFTGSADQLAVDRSSGTITISVPYDPADESRRPTLRRLTPTGQADRSFNPWSSRDGSLDITQLGLDSTASITRYVQGTSMTAFLALGSRGGEHARLLKLIPMPMTVGITKPAEVNTPALRLNVEG